MQQLIYTSAAVRPFRWTDLRQILTSARKYNAGNNISGMMVYHVRSILQVLEGPDEMVDALFARILRDPRHTALRVISHHRIERREFESWPMGLVKNMRRGIKAPGFAAYSPVELMSVDYDRAKSLVSMFQTGPLRRMAER